MLAKVAIVPSVRRITRFRTRAWLAADADPILGRFHWRIAACLFLDELPEFDARSLEVMRQP